MSDYEALARSDGNPSPDFKTQTDVERRRGVNAARLEKILNHKVFTIGQDIQAVDAQVAAKKEAVAAEKKFEKELANHICNIDKKLCYLEIQKQRAHKDWEHNVAAYNNTLIGTGSTRDLEDPKALQNDRPTRQGDCDPRLGASSFQVFAGEDLDAVKRKVRMQQQQKATIEQQITEKGTIKLQKADDERLYQERQRAILALRTQVEQQEIDLRKQIEAIRHNSNTENIAKKKEQLAEDPMYGMNNSLNAMEQIAVNNNPLLNESDKMPRTDGKPDVNNFKGHTKDDYLVLQGAQAAQVAEKKARQAADRAYDLKVDRSASAISTNVSHQMFESGKRKKEQMRLIAEENKARGEAKKLQDREDRKEASFCTPEFMNAWGSSAR